MVKSTPQPKNKKPSASAAPKAALTISRPEMLVNGSDQEFRRLVHSLFGFFSRHQTIREGHAAVIGLAGIEYTTLISIRHLAALGACMSAPSPIISI